MFSPISNLASHRHHHHLISGIKSTSIRKGTSCPRTQNATVAAAAAASGPYVSQWRQRHYWSGVAMNNNCYYNNNHRRHQFPISAAAASAANTAGGFHYNAFSHHHHRHGSSKMTIMPQYQKRCYVREEKGRKQQQPLGENGNDNIQTEAEEGLDTETRTTTTTESTTTTARRLTNTSTLTRNPPIINENDTSTSRLFHVLPPFTHPYIQLGRYHRPIGTYLLLYPTLWSCSLAAGALVPLGVSSASALATVLASVNPIAPISLYALFTIGALSMRGAGCTINDLWDRNMDGKVARTQSRPLPSGRVTVPQAVSFTILQCLVGASVLFQLNPLTILTGIASLGLVVTYPLMKRVTYWPQMYLGLTFNWGVWVGWMAVAAGEGSVRELFSMLLSGGLQGGIWSTLMATPGTSAGVSAAGVATSLGTSLATLGTVLVPLYTACIAWTIIYDTIYAHQDKADDIQAGVKSTALLFGENTRWILSGFLVVFVLGMIMVGYNSVVQFTNLRLSYPYYLSVLLSALHLFRQIHFTDLNSIAQCSESFRSNRWVGLMILMGIVGSNYLHWRAGVDRGQMLQTRALEQYPQQEKGLKQTAQNEQ